MICRVCGQKINTVEYVCDAETDLNSVYSSPVSRGFNKTLFGFCEHCKFGQIENIFDKEHYNEYNLQNIDGVKLQGGEAMRN